VPHEDPAAADREGPVALECQHIKRWDVIEDLVATGGLGGASRSLNECPWWAAHDSARKPPTSPSN
jgi:hypothetical protein